MTDTVTSAATSSTDAAPAITELQAPPRLPRRTPKPAAATATRRPAAGRRARTKPSRVPFLLLVTGLLAGGLSLLLGLNTMSAANELRRHALSEQDTTVAAQLQELQQEVADSAAPGNLARAAEQLGMVPAGAPAFLVLGKGGTVRVLGSAAPATAPPLPVQPAKKKHTTPTAAQRKAAHEAALRAAHKKAAEKAAKKHAAHGKTSKSSKSSKSSNKTTSKNTTSKTTHGAHSGSTHTPTPTPTVTLPGGTR